jgi:DNA ligase-1
MTQPLPASLTLADLGRTIAAVRATSGRKAKVEALADLLRRTRPEEAEALVGLLLGRIRQGRIGLGWRGVQSAEAAAPPAADPSLTVADVDATLEAIAGLNGPGSAAGRAEAVAGLLSRATAAERELLRGALLGDVRTGALDGVLTDALAVAVGRPLSEVRRAVMLTGDLGRTAALALHDPRQLADISLTVGVPVQPMLASTAADVAAALAVTGPASVEHKLDGARIQVHRTGDEVRVFTRSLADITSRVPEIVALARALPADGFILDGETLMLDDAGAPRPFQETMSRFGTVAAHDGVLAPRFFDVLALDGADVTDRSLTDRRALLADLVGEEHLVPGTVTADPADADAVLADALAAGHEGVLVKGIDSAYAAGRRGKAWVKVKPVHTYDLVVLAAEWGYGRRTGWLSNLHLGARDPEGAHGPAGGFVMVGKTFKGLTDELLRWQTETFPAYAVRETPGVVWLRPEIVVEIALDGVQRSPRYPGGVALRFARVKGYRDDKGAAEADTIASIRALLRD